MAILPSSNTDNVSGQDRQGTGAQPDNTPVASPPSQNPGGGGTGTVTSVALALPSSILSVSGSPVSTTGTLTGSLVNQSANRVWAGPTAGGPAAPSFRAIVAADLPLATTGAFGAVKPDGTSIVISGGIISAPGSGGGGVTQIIPGKSIKVSPGTGVGAVTVSAIGTLPWFNIQDPAYGATGNGSTDDTNAINLAIAALNAAGSGVLYIPATAAFYKTVGSLAPITVPSTVMGDGAGFSQIQFNGGPGIEFSFSTAQYCMIRDVSLFQNSTGGSTYGVFYNGGAATAYLRDLFTCERVECGGGWQIGVNVQVTGANGAARISIRDTNCYGVTWPSPTMAVAFLLIAPNNNAVIADCKSTNVTTCVSLDGTSGNPMEGTIIRNFFGPNCVNGVLASANTANTRLTDGCFFNCTSLGVQVLGDQNDIDDLYLLWNGSGATGIIMPGSYCIISHVRMLGVGSSAAAGIVVGNGSGLAFYTQISDCQIGNVSGVGLTMGPQCRTCNADTVLFNNIGGGNYAISGSAVNTTVTNAIF